MVANNIPLLWYWDGKISNGEQGIIYEDSIPKASKVNRGIKHNELNDKMHKLTGIDPRQYTLKIICRYLANGKYIPLHINDDESVDIMLDMTKERGINCVEQYLEKTCIPFGSQSCSFASDGPFIRLLMQENDASERVCLSSPIPQFPFEVTYTGVERNTIKSNDFDELHFNVHLAGIRETKENEDYACVIEGTDINNDLVEDLTEENIQEIDATCVLYKKAPVPEFTNKGEENTAILSQWVPWVASSSKDTDKEFYIGQQFSTKKELQAAVKIYSLKSHHEYVVVESNAMLLALKCKQGTSFSWKLRASIPKGATYFQVKRYTGPHTCVNPIMNRYHKQLDSDFTASQIIEVVKAQTSLFRLLYKH